MKRLWLIFAQATTIALAGLLVIQTLKPDWLSGQSVIAGPVTLVSSASGISQPGTASYANAASKAVSSVVLIYTSQTTKSTVNPLMKDPLFRHFFGDRGDSEQSAKRSGLGSGVIVSSDGYILTNNHVVESADAIEVALNDGRKLKGKVIGTDPESDLAVIKVSTPGQLPAITFAASDTLHVGDVVLAIGNPFGVGQTVTSGIVSALGRSHLGINTFENFIQTDAAINPGNSGGALIDTNGNLVGINTAIYSQSGGSMGIGFAIPVSLVKSILDQIIKSGGVTRGWVGVEIQEVNDELVSAFKLPSTSGTLISGLVNAGPAEKAGVKPGDILLAVNDKPIKDAQAMLETVASLTPGQIARFHLKRESKDVILDVTIGKRPIAKQE